MKTIMMLWMCVATLVFAQDVQPVDWLAPQNLVEGSAEPDAFVTFQGQQLLTARAGGQARMLFRWDGSEVAPVASFLRDIVELKVMEDILYVVVHGEIPETFQVYAMSSLTAQPVPLSSSPIRVYAFGQTRMYMGADHGIFLVGNGQVPTERMLESRLLYSPRFVENNGWFYFSANQAYYKTDGSPETIFRLGGYAVPDPNFADLTFTNGSVFTTDGISRFLLNGAISKRWPYNWYRMASSAGGGILFTDRDGTGTYRYDDTLDEPILLLPGFYADVFHDFDGLPYLSMGDDLIFLSDGGGQVAISDGTVEGSRVLDFQEGRIEELATSNQASHFYIFSTSGVFDYNLDDDTYVQVFEISSYSAPGVIGAFDGKVIFGWQGEEYILDAGTLTTAQTALGEDLSLNGFLGSNETHAFFMVYNPYIDYDIVRTNLTPAGTERILTGLTNDQRDDLDVYSVGTKLFFKFEDGPAYDVNGDLLPFNFEDRFYGFNNTEWAVDGGHILLAGASAQGSELWRTDGTAAGSAMITDVKEGHGVLPLGDGFEHEGAYYFMLGAAGERLLYKTTGLHLEQPLGDTVIDGLFQTEQGLYIAREQGGSRGLFQLEADVETHLGDVEGLLRLKAYGDDLVGLKQTLMGVALFRLSSGSVTILAEGVSDGFLDVLGDRIFFARDGLLEVSTGDALSVTTLMPANRGVLAEPGVARVVGEQLFFMVNDGATRPWISSGTPETTYPLTRSLYWASDLALGEPVLTVLDGVVYFSNAHEIWSTTKLESETVLAFALREGLTVVGLYQNSRGFLILAEDNTGHFELWRSRGDAGSTYQLTSYLDVDAAGARVVGDTLYFAGHTAAKGLELMRSDGTPLGTYALTDLQPGAVSSGVRGLAQAGSQIFFAAYTADGGDQLYTFCDSPDVTMTATPVCVGGEGTVAVPEAVAGASYAWSISGGTILSEDGSVMTYRADGASVDVDVTVDYPLGCRASETLEIVPADAAPAVAPVIDGPVGVCGMDRDLIFEVSNPVAGLHYDWRLPSGAVIVNGAGTARIAVHWGSVAGDVTVTAGNGCGEVQSAPYSVALQNARVQIDAGANFTSCETETWLEGQLEGGYTGMWTIEEGAGGAFSDAHDPAARFSGQAGTEYRLRWSATAVGCQPIYAEVRVRFSDAAPLADWGGVMDVRGLVEHFSACGR